MHRSLMRHEEIIPRCIYNTVMLEQNVLRI
jgi:hypothetical protein